MIGEESIKMETDARKCNTFYRGLYGIIAM